MHLDYFAVRNESVNEIQVFLTDPQPSIPTLSASNSRYPSNHNSSTPKLTLSCVTEVLGMTTPRTSDETRHPLA